MNSKNDFTVPVQTIEIASLKDIITVITLKILYVIKIVN